MKKIEDYLHLYYGAPCLWEAIDGLVGGRSTIDAFSLAEFESGRIKIKPILRPLSSMTEEEANETNTWLQWTERSSIGQISGYDAEQVRLMLLKGFDLFNLISEGLAIEKT